MTYSDIWIVFAAVWALVCAWAVVRGLKLVMLLALCLGLAAPVADVRAADLVPVCNGTLSGVSLGGDDHEATCSVAWAWVDAKAAAGSAEVWSCAPPAGASYLAGSVYFAGYYYAGCEDALYTASRLDADPYRLIGICRGTATNYVQAGQNLARCSTQLVLMSAGVERPDLFPALFPPGPAVAPEGYTSLTPKALSWPISKSAVWMVFSAFWALACAGLVIVGLRL